MNIYNLDKVCFLNIIGRNLNQILYKYKDTLFFVFYSCDLDFFLLEQTCNQTNNCIVFLSSQKVFNSNRFKFINSKKKFSINNIKILYVKTMSNIKYNPTNHYDVVITENYVIDKSCCIDSKNFIGVQDITNENYKFLTPNTEYFYR